LIDGGTAVPDRVLFVDDDANLLEGMKRNLGEQFSIVTAASPDQALAQLEKHGPFAVIVSDFKMPGMNGIELLSKAMAAWPDTVRILLTGEADTRAAVAAVNQGRVYRFLIKPCLVTPLRRTLKAAIEQHNLIQTERVLLEKTLSGSLHVLTEILSFAHPLAFSRASRIRQIVKALVEELKIPDPWEFEVAAMLSHIGCITLPEKVLQKVCSGEALAEEDKVIYESHPETGAQLLQNIPRLETAVHIIRHQFDRLEPLPLAEDLSTVDRKLLGSHLLRTAMELEASQSEHLPLPAILAGMQSADRRHSPRLQKVLAGIRSAALNVEIRTVYFPELTVGMKLHSDVLDRSGALLLSRGNEISAPVLECLRRFRDSRGVIEPLEIVPASAEHRPAAS
jgi:response regulator RpfG family c-di-GMP phosphodiesterase